MGLLGKILLLLGGGWGASKLFGGGAGEGDGEGGGIIHGVTEQAPTDLPNVTKLGGAEEIGKSGGSSAELVTWTLVQLEKNSEVDIVADLALTTFIAQSNRYYEGAAGHQFCMGLRITLHAKYGGTGIVLSNLEQQPNAEVCRKLIDPDVDPSLQIDWPAQNVYSNSRPKVAVRATATGIELRVTAPALRFSPETAVPGQGYGPDFWAKTGPYRYTLRLQGQVQTSQV